MRLSAEQITKTIGNANETAKSESVRLLNAPSLDLLRSGILALRSEAAPKTYLAILAVLLTARAMREKDQLDVLAIKAGASARGYSASSIGSVLAVFAKEQGIDLRATSSQPMNNQPFTFKPFILKDMGVAARAVVPFSTFFEVATRVNDMSSSQAEDGLAMLFHLSRRTDGAAFSIHMRGKGRPALAAVAAAVADFTDQNSENGRVGQAFCAAVLDLVHGEQAICMGNVYDPDASVPGDVQVMTADLRPWLYCEVKQKVISTGDITGFLTKVRGSGGERVEYLALKNSSYSGSINIEAVQKYAGSLDVDARVFQSPAALLDAYLPFAPGTHADVASALLSRYRARLEQSACTQELVSAYDAMVTSFASVE